MQTVTIKCIWNGRWSWQGIIHTVIFDWMRLSRIRIKRVFPTWYIFNKFSLHISSWVISCNNENPVFAGCHCSNSDCENIIYLQKRIILAIFGSFSILALTFLGTLPGELCIIISFSIVTEKTIAKSIFLIPPWLNGCIQMLFPCIPGCVRRLNFAK